MLKRLLLTLPLLIPVALCAAPVVRLDTLEYPPFEYFDSHHQPTGIAVDLVAEAFKRMHRELTISLVPWSRALRAAQYGEVDGLISAIWTQERARYLVYCSEPLFQQRILLFARNGFSIGTSHALDTLYGYRLGYVHNISYGERFDKQIAAKVFRTVDRSSDHDEAFRKLMANRYDLLVSSEYVGLYFLDKLQLQDKVTALPLEVDIVPTYFALAKKENSPALCADFSNVLARMKQDGSYKQIVERYTPKARKF